MNLLLLFLEPVVLSFIGAALVSPLVILLYRKQGWLDDPKNNHHQKVVHTTSVPRGGGIVIWLVLAVVGWLVIGWQPQFVGVVAGGFVLMLVGFFDDIGNLNPYLRIFTGILAALLVVFSGAGIDYVTHPFEPNTVIHLDGWHSQLVWQNLVFDIAWLADGLAVIWILWLMNMVNWSKGLDGQMPGFVAIAALFIGILALRFVDDPAQWPVIKLSGITTGAFLGLLLWNYFPQKIMPGYGGGSLGGFLLAVLSLLSGAKVAALMLTLAIPLIDGGFVIIRRLSQGKSPVWGDRGHLHHRLLDLGWSKPQIAWFYWITTASLGVLSLNLNSSQKFYTLLSLGLVGSSILLALSHRVSKKVRINV